MAIFFGALPILTRQKITGATDEANTFAGTDVGIYLSTNTNRVAVQ